MTCAADLSAKIGGSSVYVRWTEQMLETFIKDQCYTMLLSCSKQTLSMIATTHREHVNYENTIHSSRLPYIGGENMSLLASGGVVLMYICLAARQIVLGRTPRIFLQLDLSPSWPRYRGRFVLTPDISPLSNPCFQGAGFGSVRRAGWVA